MKQHFNYIRRLFLIAAIMLLVVVIAACAPQNGKGESRPSPTSPAENQTAGEPIEVQTPIGKLIFPQEMSANVRVQEINEPEHYGVGFFGKVGEDEVFLFAIHICDDERGYHIGSVPDEQGTVRQIWAEISGIETGEGWSEDETKRINLQQSCVNDLMEQIRQLDGFESAE
ncbi:MAG: hypothetical protein IKI42_01540 [Clostridia bacterium]|nr:hypothetical protein [Clostridia bacterium]MBR7061696.1 hypothetical protein [Clostridia bacterium]